MIANPRKYALILCAIFTCQQTVGMSASAHAYAQHLFNQATKTTGRKILLALVASYICYEVYRACALAVKRAALEKNGNNSELDNQNLPADYVTLFAHGLGGSKQCGLREHEFFPGYRDSLGINENQFHAFDFADAGSSIANMRQCALAQEKDIKQLQEQIDTQKDKNVILLGLSRGASTAITTVATHKSKNVKALIVESPFDDVKSVIANIVSYARWIPGITTVGNLAATIAFPNYSTCALRPIDVVTYVPDDIPALFICSKEDPLVPAWSTKRLYEKLKKHREERGVKNVYLMETAEGPHAGILGYNQEQYQAAVHAFHKKAGLPESTYNPELATRGEQFLTQP